jgi:D-alanyl-D-alanine carboxypeptidase/D-alanyl-D-alanine-endopeptidase (penicillin-binding protein 4)
MKIYTTAVALDMLGADYHWRTSVYADQQPDSNGTINGDLVLYGRGAPDLLSENRKENRNSLDELAIALAARGVKRVAGNVVGDESYFRGEPIGDGWQQNDLQWYFGAEASALTVNANSVDISVTPANKLGEPATVAINDNGTGYVRAINNTAMVKSGERFRIGVQRALSNNDVVVWGDVPVGTAGYGASLSVHQPSLWAAHLFVRALQKQGIAIGGSATSRNSRVPESQRFTPDNKVELASVVSQSLAEIAKITNKDSVNLYAELILRTLGRERGSMLGKETANRERGDEEAGTELIRQWLARAGVTDRVAIHDGSGLSRLNLVSPQSATGLLAGMSRTNSAATFSDTLPIAGTDGTLQGRLNDVKDRVQAKTGAIIYDNSLSGYLLTADGKRLAFSIISNDLVNRGSAIPLIDRLVLAMAKAGQPTPERSNSSPHQ